MEYPLNIAAPSRRILPANVEVAGERASAQKVETSLQNPHQSKMRPACSPNAHSGYLQIPRVAGHLRRQIFRDPDRSQVLSDPHRQLCDSSAVLQKTPIYGQARWVAGA